MALNGAAKGWRYITVAHCAECCNRAAKWCESGLMGNEIIARHLRRAAELLGDDSIREQREADAIVSTWDEMAALVRTEMEKTSADTGHGKAQRAFGRKLLERMRKDGMLNDEAHV